MAQNIYDDAAFFKEYIKLPRQVYGLDGAGEWPTLRSMVGDIQGLRVLDLGCGFGWFLRWARQEGGAKTAHGIDLSNNMLERARRDTTDRAITYEHADLGKLELENGVFDLVYSCLALHYLPNDELKQLLQQVRKALSNGGRLVFSVEHPVASAPFDASWKWDDEGRVYWPLNKYWDEGLRVTDWMAPGVKKYHRTVETYLMTLIEAGFTLKAYKESWEGLELKTDPKVKGEAHRPYFLLIAAEVSK